MSCAVYADAPVKELDLSTARRMLHAYLTNRCNLRCPQCYMDAGGQPKEELATEEWLRVLDDFTRANGESVVSFSGGEPLLRRDLFEIAAHARNQGHEIFLFTYASA